MKIDLTSARFDLDKSQISAALTRLKHAAVLYQSKETELLSIQRQTADLEAERDALKRGGDASRQTAESINVLDTQIGLLSAKPRLIQDEAIDARKENIRTIATASTLKSRVCAPLREQFMSDLEAALTPFSKDPGQQARQLVGSWSDGMSALDSFLSQERGINSASSDSELQWASTTLRMTFERLLAGKHVFCLRGELDGLDAADAALAEQEAETEAEAEALAS